MSEWQITVSLFYYSFMKAPPLEIKGRRPGSQRSGMPYLCIQCFLYFSICHIIVALLCSWSWTSSYKNIINILISIIYCTAPLYHLCMAVILWADHLLILWFPTRLNKYLCKFNQYCDSKWVINVAEVRNYHKST